MKANDFSLERLRQLREHDEQRAKEEFAASLSQRLRGQAMLKEAHHAISGAHEATRAGSGASRSGADLLAMQAWMDRLHASREQATQRLDGYDAEVEARRVALGTASQRRAVLDRLKERRRAEDRLTANRAETVVLDEIALSQHRRQSAA